MRTVEFPPSAILLLVLNSSLASFRLIRFPQNWPHDPNANQVTLVIGMNAVGDPDVFARLAIRCQHGVPKIDEQQSRLSCDVILDQSIGCFPLWCFVPTRRPGREAGERNGHFR